MKNIQFLSTGLAPVARGHYSQGLVFGDLVFISGQLPLLPDGTHINELDFESQARRTLENLFRILETAGTLPGDVLKITAYIVGVSQWPTFNRVYAEMFGQHRPARTVIPVTELHYGCLVEVDAIARVGSS